MFLAIFCLREKVAMNGEKSWGVFLQAESHLESWGAFREVDPDVLLEGVPHGDLVGDVLQLHVQDVLFVPMWVEQVAHAEGGLQKVDGHVAYQDVLRLVQVGVVQLGKLPI